MIELAPKLRIVAEFLARAQGPRRMTPYVSSPLEKLIVFNRSAGLAPITLVSAHRELNAAAATEGLATEGPFPLP